jgi:organic hydroperoxide reductase OsmC/OhrA
VRIVTERTVHEYRCRLAWSGSTGVGYSAYDRTHRVSAPPAEPELELSGDSAFGGSAELPNPEQLLLLAASSCQLLSFLAIAARARIDVVEYADEASAVMPENDPPMRITAIELKPRIVVAGEVAEERIRRYVGLAHEQCFIANSLRSEISIEPRIEFR